MSIDSFASHAAGLTAPAKSAVAVTPSDSTDMTMTSRALYIGGAGNVAVLMDDGSGTPVVFSSVPAGTILPIRAARVRSTGTTATNIVAIY